MQERPSAQSTLSGVAWTSAAGLLVVCAVGFVATYLLFVWTPWGQGFESQVMQGSPAPLDTRLVLRTRELLGHVDQLTVGGALVLAVAIAMLRRRWAAAGAAAATVLVSALVDQGLVLLVPVRPRLVADPLRTANSFPSGHVALSTAAVLALLLVVPSVWRPVVALVGGTAVLGIAAMTITVDWHRLSDTIGGNFLALGSAALAVLLLVRRGDDGDAARRLRNDRVGTDRVGRTVVGTSLAALAPPFAGYLVLGLVAGHQDGAYAAAVTLATCATTAAIGAFIVLLHRVSAAGGHSVAGGDG